jgi:DNA polymerase-3 subunit epsilon
MRRFAIAMREIVIDTETTGFDPLNGDRVVEIGAVELINRSPTGQTFHRYVCPQRAMPADAVAVHGPTAEFLANKPLFATVADEFLSFVGDASLAPKVIEHSDPTSKQGLAIRSGR